VLRSTPPLPQSLDGILIKDIPRLLLKCPEQLTSTDGLLATPIDVGPPVSAEICGTESCHDPVTKAVIDNMYGRLPTQTPQDIIKCEICKVDCVGKTVYDAHINGSKHARKLKEKEMEKRYGNLPYIEYYSGGLFTCTVCNSVMNAFTQLAAHLSGQKHLNKLAGKDKIVISNSQINSDPGKPRVDATPNLLYCATCNIHVNSPIQFEQHTSSRKHVNRVNGVDVRDRMGPYSKPSQRGTPWKYKNPGGRGNKPYPSIHNNFVPSAGY